MPLPQGQKFKRRQMLKERPIEPEREKEIVFLGFERSVTN